ncbi:hypothetical protein [Rhizobium sp. RU36D]|uniref:hypothetical protein n=1 Tax=Rhizobium sp. RU36D TaxID=1907415 RepID=UPI0009D83693|nr:hypothetical protein [Rhizobium sp. RU36D]SMD18586.1 hypothetical protein SAMN05880593_13540 [Rhizobium sp. RU36D]
MNMSGDPEALPAPYEFQADQNGLTLWKPEYDRLIVRTRPNKKVTLTCSQGREVMVFNLSPDQARHIAALITSAAEQAESGR